MWIETRGYAGYARQAGVTPHVGVWIETQEQVAELEKAEVTPHVGVWIETYVASYVNSAAWSHLM